MSFGSSVGTVSLGAQSHVSGSNPAAFLHGKNLYDVWKCCVLATLLI